jgi:diketogulonate reductase-like aldo/keto reductase
VKVPVSNVSIVTTIQDITLNSGTAIPQLGFGVWRVPEDIAESVVGQALKVGYRHIDTAALYRNEEGVGRAVASSGIPRAELFITTKLGNGSHGFDAALEAFDRSLARLGTDYVDLYLIHWPQPARDLYVETWRALERIRADGRARAIGVSNFTPAHLERLANETDVVPALDQIETHPYLAQHITRGYLSEHGIAHEAWSPLGQGGDLLSDRVITRIADAHDATAAQVVIAWHLERGSIAIPKSVTPSRIVENFAAADLTLTASEMAEIDALDRGGRIGPHPDDAR